MGDRKFSARELRRAATHRPFRLRRPPPVAMIVVCLLAVALSGCTYEDPDAAPSVAATSDQPEPTSLTCPERDRGDCLGPLDPGTYSTTSFEPSLTYTVPAGWANGEDLPGNMLLNRLDDLQGGVWGGSYIGVYQNVRAPELCREYPEPGIGIGSKELTEWYRTVPGLEILREAPASVGGLSGIALDFRVSDEWRSACPIGGVIHAVPVIIGGGVSYLHHVVGAPIEMRLFLLDWQGGNIAVEVTAVGEQHSLTGYLGEAGAEAVVGSFRFRP
jgi:hypothetical protein